MSAPSQNTRLAQEPPCPSSVLGRIRHAWAQPVNGASLGVFRIAFGLLMLLEAVTFFRPSFSSGGLSHLEVYYAGAGVRFHMPYLMDACVGPLPRWVFVGAGWLLGLGATSLALGLWHRFSAALVFASWAFLYGIECTRTYWMSYYWLELLVAFALVWMPAANRWAWDAMRLGKGASPATVPRWTVAVLRAQLVVTYFYAGVAKLNADWLVDLMPVRWFLEQPHVSARLRGLLGESWAAQLSPWLLGTPGACFFSWAGAAFDLAVGFLLLHRRTRLLALALTWTFHGINHFLLFQDIEWFPLLGATTATVFLEPSWPDDVRRWFRNPRWNPPDWRWALPGLCLVPGLGVLLGWQGRKVVPPVTTQAHPPLPAWVTAMLGTWFVLQVLVPLRHLAIPGDSRITFEGLSFSWRLKAEYYQAHPAEIVVNDPAVLRTDSSGKTLLHWGKWPGPRVIHRAVERGRIDWSVLPQVCVLTDPELGDRILFNPLAQGGSVRDEADAREIVMGTWRTLHGRAPDAVHRALSQGAIMDSYLRAAVQKGARIRTREEAMAMLQREHGRQGNGSMIPFLRRSYPFATHDDDSSPHPFLWIEDHRLLEGSHPALPRLQAGQWKVGPAMRGRMDDRRTDDGGSPVVLLTERPSHAPWTNPAPFTVWDSASEPGHPPEIRWDSLSDAGQSKFMHISLNPFLLRRYARRVADAWEQAAGRVPAIHARTFVGLNRRPPQAVVDPRADLSKAPVPWLRHAPWITGLETPRIPNSAHPRVAP